MGRGRTLLVSAVALSALAAGQPAVAGGSAALVPLEVRESVEQLSVTGLDPGQVVEVWRDGAQVATGSADDLGSVLFRQLEPGNDYEVRAGSATATGLVVESVAASQPDQSFYDGQSISEGFGYLTTRDGTQLSINVVLPGPIEEGPYPTVVEYSGYDPSNPLAGLGDLGGGVDPTPLCGELPVLCKAPAQPSSLLAGILGYAVVGVNVRGTGCSGGAYDFFEPLQVLDGYDAIEAIAAQPWVQDNRVGMVGLSYPGLSQLFVAQSQPPSLAAITPLSVYGDTGTGVLRPGGILNTGFALSWADQVLKNAAPSGTSWVRQLISDGDTTCEANQALRLQNVDVVAKARANPFYTEDVAAPLDIRRFADRIEVPVFLASAWQDEQTGPSFAELLDRFTAAPVTRFTLYNGLHADGFAPQVLSEWAAFLDLYVADEVPNISSIVRAITPVFTGAVYGGGVELPPSRWAGVTTAAAARERFEAEPPIRVIFDSGAGGAPGLPIGAFEHTATEWPDPDVAAGRWWLTPEGTLRSSPGGAALSAVSIQPDPAGGPTTYWGGSSSDIWKALPAYDWQPPPAGQEAAFQTAPLPTTVTMLGSGSLDLWVQSSATDADLEVVLSEIRPDGQEVLVQTGRLRTSYRAEETSSTELHPTHLGREADVAPLPGGQWTKARVLIPAFGHAFRAGSRIRIAVNTPGGDQPTWGYADLLALDSSTRHLIGTGGVAASSVALPILAGFDVPTPLPACPSLRGQPCRVAPPIANVLAIGAVPAVPVTGQPRTTG